MSKLSKEPFLSIVIDPPDDLAGGVAFTRVNLGELVAQYKQWGIRRIYWQYYGNRDSGLWDENGDIFSNDRAVKETYADLREPLATLCEIAHREKMEVYAILKPFDHGHGITGMLPENSALVDNYGRLKRIGGYTRLLAKYLMENKNLLVQRFPVLPEGNDKTLPIAEIRFYSSNDRPCSVRAKDLSLWVSRYNDRYQPYKGNIHFAEEVVERPEPLYGINWVAEGKSRSRVRLLRLSGLAIPEPYFAVRTANNKDRSFSNSLYALTDIMDKSGKKISFTYGLTALDEERVRPGADFREAGVSFDLPTRLLQKQFLDQGIDIINLPYSLDNTKGFLAFARGKNQRLYGAACPAYPEVRTRWLDWITECLAAGVDGVIIRTANHNRTLEWGAYGFNPPVVKAFKQNYGIDITRAAFDRSLWRQLRGTFFTDFLAAASRMARDKKRRFGIVVDTHMLQPLEKARMLEIYYDWQSWLDQGLVDNVLTMYMLPNNSDFVKISRKGQETARNIAMVAHPGNEVSDKRLSDIREKIKAAEGYGVKEFVLYENHSILKLQSLTSISCRNPKITDEIKHWL